MLNVDAGRNRRRTMRVRTAVRNRPDTCLELVKRCPLAPIKNDNELVAAQKMINELLQQHLDTGAQVYFDVLTELVEAYEDEHVLIPDASQADVLRELMTANSLSQSKLAKEVGVSPSTISAVLGGERSLTKEQVTKLAKFFHVSPSVFLPA
jgi:HTH-type transcriptional regulator / antitoxin HigA